MRHTAVLALAAAAVAGATPVLLLLWLTWQSFECLEAAPQFSVRALAASLGHQLTALSLGRVPAQPITQSVRRKEARPRGRWRALGGVVAAYGTLLGCQECFPSGVDPSVTLDM